MSCDKHKTSRLVSGTGCLLCAIDKVARQRDDALYRISSVEEDLHCELEAKEALLLELADARHVIEKTVELRNAMEGLRDICSEAAEILDAPVFNSAEYENTLDAMRAAGYLDD